MPDRDARADGYEQARGGTAPFVAESNGAENGAGPRRASELGCSSCVGYCRVITPPAGGAGGNELSGRSRPGACVGARADGREWGAGGGEALLGFLRLHSDSELHPPLCVGYCRVITPPAGGAGGNELSGRSRPGACVGARADGREWGAGGGEALLGFLRLHSDSELHPPLCQGYCRVTTPPRVGRGAGRIGRGVGGGCAVSPWCHKVIPGKGAGERFGVAAGFFTYLDSTVLLICVLQSILGRLTHFWKFDCGTTVPHFSKQRNLRKVVVLFR